MTRKLKLARTVDIDLFSCAHHWQHWSMTCLQRVLFVYKSTPQKNRCTWGFRILNALQIVWRPFTTSFLEGGNPVLLVELGTREGVSFSWKSATQKWHLILKIEQTLIFIGSTYGNYFSQTLDHKNRPIDGVLGASNPPNSDPYCSMKNQARARDPRLAKAWKSHVLGYLAKCGCPMATKFIKLNISPISVLGPWTFRYFLPIGLEKRCEVFGIYRWVAGILSRINREQCYACPEWKHQCSVGFATTNVRIYFWTSSFKQCSNLIVI